MDVQDRRRASLRRVIHLLRNGALLLLLWGSGCREDTPVNIPPAVDLTLHMIAGSSYEYDTWRLDFYGFRIPSTLSRRSLTVTDTGVVFGGFSHVVRAVDSVFVALRPGEDTLDHVDSVYLRVASNGDVFWYGFLATLMEKREGSIIERRWDLLASPSAGTAGWSVGTTDSAASETAFGRFFADQELIAVSVNGVSRAVSAYRVEITSPRLEFTLWIAETPPGFLRFREESDGFAGIAGAFDEIVSVSLP